MPNYMLDAMQGYKFVNDINRQDERDKMLNQQHTMAMDREQRAVDQDLANKNVAKMTNDAVLAGLGGDGLQPQAQPVQNVQQPQQQQQQEHPVFQGWKQQLTKYGIDPNSPQGAMATEKARPLLENPEALGKAMYHSDVIMRSLGAGKLPPRKDYVSLLNIAEGPAINARAVAQGNAAGVLHDVFPGPDGKSVVMELKLTRPDGTEYLAPATTGKSTDPKDNQVQLFPIATMAERLGTTVEGMRMILAAQSAAGSTAAVDHYNTYKDSRQALNDQVTVKNMEDYASDGKSLVSKNEYLKMSADQRARFVPLKQIDIDMKERQLNATISAANKPGELEKRIAQIRSMKLSPEEEKAALLQIALGAKPGMTESQAIMTLMRMDAHNDKKSEKETKYALQLDEVLSSTGGEVNAQNLNRVNILRKANGLPLMEKVNVKGGKKGLMWDSDTVEFREKDAPAAAGGLPTQSQAQPSQQPQQ